MYFLTSLPTPPVFSIANILHLWYLCYNWWANIVSICNSLLTEESEHLFICLFAVCILFLVWYLFIPFTYFEIELIVFFVVVDFYEFFVYFVYQSFIRIVFWRYFLPVGGLSFQSLEHLCVFNLLFSPDKISAAWSLGCVAFFCVCTPNT